MNANATFQNRYNQPVGNKFVQSYFFYVSLQI